MRFRSKAIVDSANSEFLVLANVYADMPGGFL